MSTDVIAKHEIAASFGRAAGSYDSVAHFQRWVGDTLLDKLPQKPFCSVLDLGTGTGYFLPSLAELSSRGRVFGLDLSAQMVEHAILNERLNRGFGVVGDADFLPFKEGAFDLVFSSLAIQWCSDFSALFREVKRVLSPGGVFAFTSLLDGTLEELGQAWAVADTCQHVNHFAQKREYEEAIVNSGLSRLGFDTEVKTLYYDKVRDLTRELKLLGAHNMTPNRAKTMTGKGRVSRFIEAYDSFRDQEGRLPASYRVCFGLLQNGLAE